MSSNRDDAIRDALVGYVAAHPARPRRAAWIVGLLLAGAVVGGGASSAALAAAGVLRPGPAAPSGEVSPNLPSSVPAPAGVIPGSSVDIIVSTAWSESFAGDASVALPDVPAGATHLRVTITPSSPGTVSFGTDANGNNPSASWASVDPTRQAEDTAQFDFAVGADLQSLFIATADMTGQASLQYITTVPTRFGVNAKGQTYGITGSAAGEPDLIAVRSVDGELGYILKDDLDAATGAMVRDPDGALAWVPGADGRTVAVYQPDGETRIGEFIVSGAAG